MTREETLKHFKTWCQQALGNNCSDKDLHMANNIIALLEQKPCDDCVSRQAVFDIVERAQYKGDALSEIEKSPSVTPQPKMGKWIYRKEEDSYRCSLCTFPCHKDNLGAIPTEYCAGCGAKMSEV